VRLSAAAAALCNLMSFAYYSNTLERNVWHSRPRLCGPRGIGVPHGSLIPIVREIH
jgi:hypothetical protein